MKIRIRELQHDLGWLWIPNTRKPFSSFFPFYLGYHRGVFNARHFVPPDTQSAPCSQSLSSHFTRSTRWKPRKWLYLTISPSASILRRPRLVKGNDSRVGYADTNTCQHTHILEHLLLLRTQTQAHIFYYFCHTAAWHCHPLNINKCLGKDTTLINTSEMTKCQK